MRGDPTPGQRVRYALGGRLPDSAQDWVRHDLLDAGWRWRALRRLLAQALVPALLLALLPGPAFLRVLLPVFVLVCATFTAAAYAEDLRDRRLRQHGLIPPPAARPLGKRDLR